MARTTLGVRRGSGFTLVELLVSAMIAGVVLSAAYGWLWNVGALARAQDDRAQAETIAAAATRVVTSDIRDSLSAADPAPGHDPSRALFLQHDHPSAVPESVTVVWDPVRKVLWRNASGTYVADHISAFSVAYILVGGQAREGAAMTASDWTEVEAVQIALTAEVGASVVKSRALVRLAS